MIRREKPRNGEREATLRTFALAAWSAGVEEGCRRMEGEPETGGGGNDTKAGSKTTKNNKQLS